MPRKLRRVAIVLLTNILLSMVMLAVSYFLGALDPPFFYGTLAGVLLSTAQFALLANSFEKTAGRQGGTGMYMAGQYAVRFLILAAAVIVAMSTRWFDPIPMIIAVFFPQVLIIVDGIFDLHWL